MRPSILLLAALLLAGCADVASREAPPSPASPSPLASSPEPAALAPAGAAGGWRDADTGAGCRFFCEPSVAIDPAGRVFVLGDALAVSLDGGATWTERDPPPVPDAAPPGSFHNDALLQTSPDGALYHSSLVTHCTVQCRALLLLGMSVSRSTDAAKSWEFTTYVALPEPHALGSDRQWLSFSPDGLVCLSDQRYGPAIVYTPVQRVVAQKDADIPVSCSGDGGRSFPPFVSAIGGGIDGGVINGRPVFTPEGRMALPYFASPDWKLRVALSDDGARTFRQVAVGPRGSYFPGLAVDATGSMRAAWRDEDARLVLARSEDGGETWSAPIAVAEELATSPWVEATHAGVALAWFERTSERTNDLVAFVAEERIVLREGLASDPYRRAATDFAHFALAPEGRVAVVYGDLDAQQTRLALSP